MRAKLAELQKEDREHMHPKERDAQVMKNHEGTRLGYNAQAVVESEHGLIVAAEVTNEQNDLHQLVPMIDKVKEELGTAAEETLADSGYWNGEQLSGAEKNGYPVLVNLDAADARNRGGDYDASQFMYDKERDCCICPRGGELKYERTRKPDGKPHPRVYRCSGYKECPVRWECSKDKQGRRVELSPHNESFLRQREKQSDGGKKSLLRQRMRIVEPVFAVVKERLGFRRWTVGGLEKVRAQWTFLAGLVNLLRLYAIWKEGKLVLA